GTLKLEAIPGAERWKLNINALGWQAPLRAPLAVDYAELQGVFDINGVRFDKIDMKLFNGLAAGQASLRWQTEGVPAASAAQFEATLDLTRFNSRKLMDTWMPGVYMDGDLSGKLVLHAQADSLQKLQDAMLAV